MPAGRIGKYEPEIVEEICKHLRLGMTIVDTCTLVDIHQDTFFTWIKAKPEFAESVKKAQLQSKRRAMGLVQQAAEQTWQAAAWWLERRYPSEFAARNMNLNFDGHTMIEQWKKELKIDEQSLSDISKMDMGDLPEETLPLPETSGVEDSQSLPD